jgi:hypothetical protein
VIFCNTKTLSITELKARHKKAVYMKRTFNLLNILCLFLPLTAFSAEIKLPAIADNSIVIYPGEEHLNAGGKSQIRIKGNQHLVVMKFDTSILKGKIIESAELVCSQAANSIGAVSISTIAADWDEYKSSALTSGKLSEKGWAWTGGRFMEVCGSNSFTQVSFAKSRVKNGWYHWQVAPDLIYANVLGLAHGLVIHETLSDYSRNPTILSREQSGKVPYLLVKFKSGSLKAPYPVKKLKLYNLNDFKNLALKVKAPLNGFAYQIKVNSKPLPQWNVPLVKPGKIQIIPIRDIKLTKGPIRVEISVLNRLGEKSKSVICNARIKIEKTIKPLLIPLWKAKKNINGIGIIPLEDKYDSQGKAIGKLPENYLFHNAIYNGSIIKLAAAKGEVIGFQVLIPNTNKPGPITCTFPKIKTECYQIQYVKTKTGKQVPEIINPNQGQQKQGKYIAYGVDIYIPFKFNTKQARGILALSDGTIIPIVLRIRNFSLPQKASFLCEMNTYGVPDKLSEFYKLQELAYKNRLHVNILHYGHSSAAPGARKCVLDMRMDMFGLNGNRMNEQKYNNIKPSAKFTYWNDFVSAFDPYLSGKYFKDGHRGIIPAPGFYLTFHESWPLNVRSFFNGNPDAYKAFKEKPQYSETFKNILKDFIKTAKKKGWSETGFQVYLNNKGKLKDSKKAPWILDEPTAFWDFRALRYYADLVKEAKGTKCPVKIDYRIDISRPQFDRGELWNTSDLWVVNTSAMLKYPRIIHDRKTFSGEKMWVYGTTNPVETSNRETMAWVMESFVHGAVGIVPWQTVNKNGEAMIQADQLGLFVFSKGEIYQSLRLKAYRRVEQDIEYLLLLQKKFNITDSELRNFIEHYLPINGNTIKKNTEDAGTRKYIDISPENFRRLREATAKLLEKKY